MGSLKNKPATYVLAAVAVIGLVVAFFGLKDVLNNEEEPGGLMLFMGGALKAGIGLLLILLPVLIYRRLQQKSDSRR